MSHLGLLWVFMKKFSFQLNFVYVKGFRFATLKNLEAQLL